MDGYAVSSADYRGIPGETFTLAGTVAAGDTPAGAPKPGQGVRIMTGAPMPAGTDKVIRVEYTEAATDGRITVHTPEPDINVIPLGSNIRSGEVLVSPCRLTAKTIGILAAGGVNRVRVRRLPRFGIITTGSEIREPGAVLEAGQIYNSNGSQLKAQIEETGAPVNSYGIVADEPVALREVIDTALNETDILLLSGGVSMGDFDYVPRILSEAGVEILFHRLAIKPGRPTLFGRRNDTFVFGLPGNPVSTFVIFELLVREFLGVINGVPFTKPVVRARLGSTVSRNDTARVEYQPARLNAGLVEPLFYAGSSHLNALAEADCLFRMDQYIGTVSQGTEIDAFLI